MILLAVSPADSSQFRFLLNALPDRAFDSGLIALDDRYRVALSSHVPHTPANDQRLYSFDGSKRENPPVCMLESRGQARLLPLSYPTDSRPSDAKQQPLVTSSVHQPRKSASTETFFSAGSHSANGGKQMR